MSLNAKKVAGGGGDRVAQANLEPGNYPARIAQILDYGIQPQRPYQGKDKPPAQEIGITYELLDEFMKDADGNDVAERPRWVSETFVLHNLKADKAKSTQRYNALDPKCIHDGDFTALAGDPCMVTVVNNESAGKVYDNVGSVSAMRPRDAATAPDLQNPCRVFVLDEPDMDAFNSLPEWIQEKIKGNLGFKGSPLEKTLSGGKVEKKAKDEPKVGEDAPFEGGVENVDLNTPY